MTEDPIKLFTTRAERSPKPTDADIALGTVGATLSAITHSLSPPSSRPLDQPSAPISEKSCSVVP